MKQSLLSAVRVIEFPDWPGLNWVFYSWSQEWKPTFNWKPRALWPWNMLPQRKWGALLPGERGINAGQAKTTLLWTKDILWYCRLTFSGWWIRYHPSHITGDNRSAEGFSNFPQSLPASKKTTKTHTWAFDTKAKLQWENISVKASFHNMTF